MSANPYHAPNAPLQQQVLPQHTRPLWCGVLLASLFPALFVAIPMSVWGGVPPGITGVSLAIMAGVLGVLVSAPATVVLGLPAVLLLRRAGLLRGGYVCQAALLVGAAVGASLSVWDIEDGVSLEGALRGAGLGGLSGLTAGIGMSLGAGIPLWRRRGAGRIGE